MLVSLADVPLVLERVLLEPEPDVPEPDVLDDPAGRAPELELPAPPDCARTGTVLVRTTASEAAKACRGVRKELFVWYFMARHYTCGLAVIYGRKPQQGTRSFP